MSKVRLFYMIKNGGDGSASVDFYADEPAAQLACDLETERGEPFDEQGPHGTEFEFDAGGRLLNPYSTKEELKRELAERRGEEADEAYEEDSAPARAFNTTAADQADVFSLP